MARRGSIANDPSPPAPSPLRPWTGRSLLPLAILAAIAAVPACDGGETIRPDRRERRAVSMSPALTQILLDLGLEAKVVGVGRDDPLAGADGVVNIGGGLRAFDREAMVNAAPTDIFVQTEAGNVPTGLTTLADRRGWRVHAYKLERINDIRAAIADGKGGGIGAAMGAPVRGLERRAAFDAKMKAIADAVGDAPPRRILLLPSGGEMGQLFACGVGTFLDQVLPLVGATNALDGHGPDGDPPIEGYPSLDLETVAKRANDLVIVLSSRPKPTDESGDADADADAEGDAASMLRRLNDRLGGAFEVRVLHDPDALLPSTTLPRVAAKLAKLAHPELAGRIDAALDEAVREIDGRRGAGEADAASAVEADAEAGAGRGAASGGSSPGPSDAAP